MAEALAKSLPAYAMQLLQAGEDISVDLLLAAADAGLKPSRKQKRKEKASLLERYEAIVSNMSPPDDRLPLIAAAQEGDLARTEALLDEGADIHAISDDALRRTAYNGHTETVRLLLDRGAKIDALTKAQWHSFNPQTAFWIICKNTGRLESSLSTT